MNELVSNRKIVITNDGSPTLFVPELNEHYHSIHGAVQESVHVFINAGLNTFTENHSISVLEVGFGTGLNALLTIQEGIKQGKNINYTAIEKYPITHDEIEKLDFAKLLGTQWDKVFRQMHDSTWNAYTAIDIVEEKQRKAIFQLKKIHSDLLLYIPDEKFDLVYFDAFSPNVQPELWSVDVFGRIYNCLNQKGILVTYSAKGIVKQNLRAAGFKVKRLPGPPGKREMLRATKE